MNLVKTSMLLGGLTAVFMAAGYLLGGTAGMIVALLFAAGTNLYAFWNSGTLTLKMHAAQPATSMSFPTYVEAVARLSRQAGLPVPGTFVIDSRQPNAFATGRDPDNAAVAVTTGLLNSLSAEEVEGVIAHELAHIKNRDTLIMTIAATFAGAVSFLANIGFLLGGNRERGQYGIVGVPARCNYHLVVGPYCTAYHPMKNGVAEDSDAVEG